MMAHAPVVDADVATSMVTVERSPTPASSVNVDVKVWTLPFVLGEVTETAATLKATVHAPLSCHPVTPSELFALIYTFFVPIKAPRNVNETVSVKLFPESTTLDPAPL